MIKAPGKRDHFEDQGPDGTILKWISNSMGWCTLHSSASGEREVAGT